MLNQEQKKMKLMTTDRPVGDKADYERYVLILTIINYHCSPYNNLRSVVSQGGQSPSTYIPQ